MIRTNQSPCSVLYLYFNLIIFNSYLYDRLETCPFSLTEGTISLGRGTRDKLEWVWIVNVKCLDNFSARTAGSPSSSLLPPSSEYHLGPGIRDTRAPNWFSEWGASAFNNTCISTKSFAHVRHHYTEAA